MSLILKNGIVLTEDGYKNTDIIIDDGKITNKKLKGETIDVKGNVIFPAFFNGHTHLNEAFCPHPKNESLEVWSNKVHHVASKMKKTDYISSAEFSCLDMLASGFTGLIAHEINYAYKFWKEPIKILKNFRMKGIVARSIMKEAEGNEIIKYNKLQKDAEAILSEKQVNFIKEFNKKNEKIKIWLGLAETGFLPYTNLWKKILNLSEIGIGCHVHIFENYNRRLFSYLKYSGNPLKFIQKCGNLNSNINLVHCVFSTDEDIKIMKKHDITVSINPESNINLVRKLPPLPKIIKNGIKFTVGTDGAAGTYDMFKQISILENKFGFRFFHLINMESPSFVNKFGIGKINKGFYGDIVVVNKNFSSKKFVKIKHFFIEGEPIITDGKFIIPYAKVVRKYRNCAKKLSKITNMNLVEIAEKRIDRLQCYL